MTGADELYDEIRTLIEEAAQTGGAKLEADLRMVWRSLGIFTSNAAELRVQISEEERTENWLGLDQAEFEKRMDEIDRLLHNFLAAAYTLSQLTMKVRNAYANQALNEAYEQESPFGEPLFRIVKKLRTDAQHVRLPVLQQRQMLQMTPQPAVACQLVVNRRYLETLDLDAATRDYVAGLAEDPPLDMLVDAYTLRVERFTRWFVDAVRQASRGRARRNTRAPSSCSGFGEGRRHWALKCRVRRLPQRPAPRGR